MSKIKKNYTYLLFAIFSVRKSPFELFFLISVSLFDILNGFVIDDKPDNGKSLAQLQDTCDEDKCTFLLFAFSVPQFL
jgi:hypothetical protein